MRDRHRLLPARRRRAPTMQVAERAQRRDRARRQLAVVDGVDQLAPRAIAPSDFGCSPAASSGGARRRSASGSIACSASITPLPMPRAGTLITRRKLTSSCGLMISLQVGERVLDFLALVEADAADDLVGDALAHQRVFDRARLRVGAIEHRHRRCRRPRARACLIDPDDEVGLLELVVAAEVDDLRAALAIGPEPLVLAVAVLADDRRRGVEDDLRRAVVLLEPDDRALRGKSLLEVEDVAQVGAAPLVDRLIGIADDARGCGGLRRAGGSACTAAGWCPGTRRP